MKNIYLLIILIAIPLSVQAQPFYLETGIDYGPQAADYNHPIVVSAIQDGPAIQRYSHFNFTDTTSIQFDAMKYYRYSRLSYAVIGVDSAGRIFPTKISSLPFALKSNTITINGDAKDLTTNRSWTLTSDNVSEGVTNFYYTAGRFNTSFAAKNTDNLAEGASNLYYTLARFNTAFSTKTTSNLTEGSNLYYTNARARSAISVTNTGTSGNATFDNSTGVLNIPNYSTGVTVSAPSTANAITSGTAFQPSTTGNSTTTIVTKLVGALGIVGDVVIEYSTTSGGTYTTYTRESLGLLLAGTVYSSVTISLPANYWVKVTLTQSGLATISATYTKVGL